MIASSLAVELMTSVLHAEKALASNASPTLGVPPHSIRGWLSASKQIAPTFQKFDKCSACSKRIVAAYRDEGIELVLKVLDDPLHLERLSGLDKLKDGLDEILELSDDESD